LGNFYPLDKSPLLRLRWGWLYSVVALFEVVYLMRLLFLSSLNIDKRLLLLRSNQNDKLGVYFEVTSIKLKSIGNDIRLHLKSKMPLISADEPLPPRGDMHEYFAPDSRLSMIRQQTCHCTIS
jgi:hypothetical protein